MEIKGDFMDRKLIAAKYKALIDTTKEEIESLEMLLKNPDNPELIKNAKLAYIKKHIAILDGNLMDHMIYYQKYLEHSQK